MNMSLIIVNKYVPNVNFIAWERALAFILEDVYSQEEAIELAQESVPLTQGAIMMTLHNDSKNYLKVGEKIINLL